VHFVRNASGSFWGVTLSVWGKTASGLLLLINVFILHRFENLFRSSNIPVKITLKYPILGTITASIINFTIFSRALAVSTVDKNYFSILSYGTIFLGITFLYACVRYKPFEIKVNKTETTSTFSILLTGIYILSLALISYISNVSGISYDKFTILLFAIFAAFLIASAAISGKARRSIRRFVSSNFQPDKYNYRKEWIHYSHIMNTSLTRKDLLNNTISSLCETMLVSRGCIWTNLAENNISNYGLPLSENCSCIFKEIIKSIGEKERVFFFNKSFIGDLFDKNPPLLKSGFTSDAVWIKAVAILKSGDENLGMIALGQKDTKSKYSEEDRSFLSTISEELTLALENMLLEERIIESDRIESFDRFTSFVTHDLKNTLGMLSLTAENAKRNMDNPDFQKDTKETLNRAVEKISELIDSLTVHKSPPALSKNATDIGTLLRNGAASFEKIASSKNIVINLNIEDNLLAMTDAKAFIQIMENLVTNSVEASEPEESIDITARRDINHSISVTISDNGNGFDPAYLDSNLFKPFRSTKKYGLGIGLVICKSIAEAHGGSIMINSERGKGASVTVRIPSLQNK
jgi:putative PEP-CTERM system histidine kinase